MGSPGRLGLKRHKARARIVVPGTVTFHLNGEAVVSGWTFEGGTAAAYDYDEDGLHAVCGYSIRELCRYARAVYREE